MIGQLSPAGFNYLIQLGGYSFIHPDGVETVETSFVRFNHHNCCWLHPHNTLWLAISWASKVVHGTGVGSQLRQPIYWVANYGDTRSVSRWVPDELWPECLGVPPRWRLRLVNSLMFKPPISGWINACWFHHCHWGSLVVALSGQWQWQEALRLALQSSLPLGCWEPFHPDGDEGFLKWGYPKMNGL